MTPLAVYEITDLCCRDESCVCAVGREDQCCTRAGTGTEDGTEGDGMMMISECNTFPRRCLPDICNINIGEGGFPFNLDKFTRAPGVNCICYLAMLANVCTL
jgi:hypothetical protein